MFNVTRRVSFSIAIALTVGWGIFFLLFLASSNTLLQTEQYSGERLPVLPPGVKINVQVDKRVYRGGDPVLIAVRNDSRLPIWTSLAGEACLSAWWHIEQLSSDGETWSNLVSTKQECPTNGVVQFANHSLKTDTWLALVPGTQIGNVLINAPTGTYRVTIPYLKGKTMTSDSWKLAKFENISSTQFTIQ